MASVAKFYSVRAMHCRHRHALRIADLDSEISVHVAIPDLVSEKLSQFVFRSLPGRREGGEVPPLRCVSLVIMQTKDVTSLKTPSYSSYLKLAFPMRYLWAKLS